MDPEYVIENLLTDGGRRRAIWILLRAGKISNSDLKPEKPVLEDDGLSEYELNAFDTVEMMVYADEYENAYRLALKFIEELRRAGRYRSALYLCQMIGDELLKREILKEGMVFYESLGDFKKAMEFANMLGDVRRREIYGFLYGLLVELQRL